ncbi:MAG: TetR/AcrR family transcriptional regulator [Pseudomonadota bacterium]
MEKRPARSKQDKDDIAYHGRRTARAGSEQRRRAILEAALRIIIRDGVRAVRHRAVAAEAGVPLSATTYYFKDIHDLIADTFTLFVENALAKVIDPVWIEIYQFTAQYSAEQLRDPHRRAELIAGLARLSANFVERELSLHREHLLAERAFLQAAVVDERLRAQADMFRKRVIEGLTSFCTMLGTIDPPLDAEMIHDTFMMLEYEHLIRTDGSFDRDRVERVMAHRMRLMIRGE